MIRSPAPGLRTAQRGGVQNGSDIAVRSAPPHRPAAPPPAPRVTHLRRLDSRMVWTPLRYRASQSGQHPPRPAVPLGDETNRNLPEAGSSSYTYTSNQSSVPPSLKSALQLSPSLLPGSARDCTAGTQLCRLHGWIPSTTCRPGSTSIAKWSAFSPRTAKCLPSSLSRSSRCELSSRTTATCSGGRRGPE